MTESIISRNTKNERSDVPSFHRPDVDRQDAEDSSSLLRESITWLFSSKEDNGGSNDNDSLRAIIATNMGQYGAQFLKTAALFTGGRVGLVGTMLLNGFDRTHSNSDLQTKIMDFGLGAAEGAVLKGAYHLLGKAPLNPQARGVILGVANRAAETAFNRQAYITPKGPSLGAAFDRTVSYALSPRNLSLDFCTWSLASGLEKVVAPSAPRTQLMKNLLAGGSFGFAGGTIRELTRQEQLGPTLDYQKILNSALLGGGLDALGAAAGGSLPFGRRANVSDITGDGKTTSMRDKLNLRERLVSTNELSDSSIVQHALKLVGTPSIELPTNQAHRLSNFTRENYQLPVSVGGSVEQVSVPVRAYGIEGHSTRVLVPESYAQKLDAMRTNKATGRSGDHPLADRMLPEDVVPMLDALPNPALVQHIILRNEPNPLDPVHAAASKQRNFVSVASADMQTFDITFYRKNRSTGSQLELQHEWSHFLKPIADAEYKGFKAAFKLEPHNEFARSRAADGLDENIAVLTGEHFLHPDRAVFLDFTHQAPLRALAISNMIDRVMRADLLPPEVQTNPTARAETQWRIDYAQSQLKPQALQDLVKGQIPARDVANFLLLTGNADALRNQAAELNLANLELNSQHVRGLQGSTSLQTIDLSGTQVANLDFAIASPGLKRINLSGTPFYSSGLARLPELKALQHLDLSHTRINESSLPALIRASGLKSLNLHGTNMRLQSIERLREELPGCRIEF